MFLCLSSGSSKRYREDVLRALAQPWGSTLQFRYLKKYFAAGILEKAKAEEKNKPQVLIAYLDLSDQNKVPEVVPCRFALLTRVTEVGTFVTLQFELQEFAVAADLSKSNSELKEKSLGVIPVWQAEGEKKWAKGDYCLEVSSEPTTIRRSQNLEDWEKVVRELADRTDFKDEGSFYTIVGISEIPSRAAISVSEGRYQFLPGHEYELALCHFYPRDIALTNSLALSTTSQWLSFTTNPSLHLDSRYDLKHARFKAGKPSNDEDVWLSVTRNVNEGALPYVEFDLSGRVRGVFWQTLGYGLILGCFLAGPQIIAALSNPNLPANNVVLVCSASGIISLVTGIFAAFGLKKSP